MLAHAKDASEIVPVAVHDTTVPLFFVQSPRTFHKSEVTARMLLLKKAEITGCWDVARFMVMNNMPVLPFNKAGDLACNLGGKGALIDMGWDNVSKPLDYSKQLPASNYDAASGGSGSMRAGSCYLAAKSFGASAVSQNSVSNSIRDRAFGPAFLLLEVELTIRRHQRGAIYDVLRIF